MEETQPSPNYLWWQRGVVYQIYPRSFLDTRGNGLGDLQGIIRKLDYLNDGTEASLGVDAIWISPFYPSPMADAGYDVADYCDIDPVFGDLETFDLLVAEAHRRGIKVIIDYVPNHTSDKHRWFIDARSSRTDPKRDWYIWRDPKPDGSPPNNWGSFFGGPAWTLDESTGQYYLHQFAKEQPELNWRNPAVHAAMLDVLRFWLDRGVDGFRMDVVGLLMKDADLRDNPPNPDAPPDLPPNDLFRRQLPIYTMDLDEVHTIMRDFRRLLDSYDERCAIGELWFELPRWIKYYGENGDGLHLPFNFRLMSQPWEAAAIRRSVDELEAALPSFGWPNYVLGSHDFPRLASRIGQAGARLAAMLLLTLRGTPTLYNGDEIGMENGVIPLDKIQDPQGLILGPERTRDITRTPLQWDSTPQAGFSPVEPWLPVSADYLTRNVAAQSQDPASLLTLYRRLLWIRRREPALQWGSYQALDVDPENVYAFLREDGDQVRLVVLNFGEEALTLEVPGSKSGQILLSTYLDRDEIVDLSALQLRPTEGLLITL